VQPNVTGLLMVGKRMNVLRTIAVLSATAVLMTACGGGGRVAPVGTAPESDSGTGRLTLSAAFGGVAIAAAGRQRSPASGPRRPSFITPGLQSLAVYDGTTLVYVANVDLAGSPQFTTVYANPNPRYAVIPAGCTNNATTETCQLEVDAKPGPHAFDLIAYPAPQTAVPGGGPPVFIGVISSEGEVSVKLHPHEVTNASLVMLGVASNAQLSGPDEAAFNQTVQYSYEVRDSTPLQILIPGAYDNGPVTISVLPSDVATVTPPTSFASPASSPGFQTFSVTCVNPNGGLASVLLQANAQPNTSYASQLTYSAANYSSGTLAATTLTCDGSPATLPITVQSHKRAH
jgi:hypothetical protein